MEFNPLIHNCGNWYTARHCTNCNIPFNKIICPKCGTHFTKFNKVAVRDIFLKRNVVISTILTIITLGVYPITQFIGHEFKHINE